MTLASRVVWEASPRRHRSLLRACSNSSPSRLTALRLSSVGLASLRLTTFVSPRLAIACLTAPHHRALPASSHAWGPGTIAERPFLQRTSNSAYRSVLCPHASRNRSWNRNSDHNRNHAFFQKQIVDSVAYVDGKLTNQVLEKEAAKCEEKVDDLFSKQKQNRSKVRATTFPFVSLLSRKLLT